MRGIFAFIKPAREARGPKGLRLRALGLLLADGAPNFFWGGSNGKVVAPGIVVICSIDKNCDH